jgi:hypothetical protein
MPTYDITDSTPFDLTSVVPDTTFNATNTAYDLTIDDIPFIVNVNNQNQYRRETAQYKKDQFDASVEPGEQSLTGWWLRSQTSFHNGAGIKFYEPGTDYQHVSHRFSESRGIDIWDIGEAKLLPKTVDVYTGNNLVNAAVGWNGTGNCLVTGDSKGLLKKVSLNDNSDATVSDFTALAGGSYPQGHSGTDYPFNSVTTDGTHYYATCTRCVHSGTIGTANSDRIMYRHSTASTNDVFISYVKGYLILGSGNVLTNLNTATSTLTSALTHINTGTTQDIPTGTEFKKIHLNDNWSWNSATSSPGPIYVSGNAGNNGEIWSIGIDDVNDRPDMPAAKMVASLPIGETINSIHYYLGYLAVGTSKGLRICSTDQTGNLILGPLLYEGYPVTGFTTKRNYIYASTKVDNDSGQLDTASKLFTHACAIRVDLSAQFDDGTFAWTYDLEYESTNQPSYSVSAKSLTSNVATITTSIPHGFAPLNDVTISNADTTYRISNKALTGNVATITTLYAHGFTTNNTVTVTGVDSVFDGAYLITSTPTTTTFTYAKTNANVTSAAVTSASGTYAYSTSTNSIFNGSYTIVATPTPTTFTYSKTNANVLETTVFPLGSVKEKASSSKASEVYELNDRIVLVVDETGVDGITYDSIGTGELHAEHTTDKRTSGWLKTGTIRFGTVEPKWFRYINMECKTGEGDTITIAVTDETGNESDLISANQGLSLTDILIVNPETAQKSMAFKFTFNNVSNDTNVPILESYQVKASPATRRQRLIQYPLSCFDREMDKYGSTFGYDGRAKEIIDRLEALEETSRFVTFTDYRTNESFVGLIEDVKFSSESSPDKNSNGFGGVLIVTVRKL